MEGSKAYWFLYFAVFVGIATCAFALPTSTIDSTHAGITTGTQDLEQTASGDIAALTGTLANNTTTPSGSLANNTTTPSGSLAVTESSIPTMEASSTRGPGSPSAKTSAAPKASSTAMPHSSAAGCGKEKCFLDRRTGTLLVILLGVAVVMCTCLLVIAVVLACQVCYLRSQPQSSRPVRSNADLISSTGYWGIGTGDAEAETSVMLTEVRLNGEAERGAGEAATGTGEANTEKGTPEAADGNGEASGGKGEADKTGNSGSSEATEDAAPTSGPASEPTEDGAKAVQEA